MRSIVIAIGGLAIANEASLLMASTPSRINAANPVPCQPFGDKTTIAWPKHRAILLPEVHAGPCSESASLSGSSR